jgi:hypothetical protein
MMPKIAPKITTSMPQKNNTISKYLASREKFDVTQKNSPIGFAVTIKRTPKIIMQMSMRASQCRNLLVWLIDFNNVDMINARLD